MAIFLAEDIRDFKLSLISTSFYNLILALSIFITIKRLGEILLK